MNLLKRLFCKHIHVRYGQLEKKILTEPNSSESGWEVWKRYRTICDDCGRVKHTSKWTLVRKYLYGGILAKGT
jgi:hypothetical protein